MQHRIHFKAIDYTLTFDDTELAGNVFTHLFEYGVRQALTDSYASDTDAETRRASFDKRWASYLAGELRASRESDPLGIEARKIAVVMVNKELGKYNAKSPKDFVERWKARVAALSNDAGVLAKAQRIVDILNESDIPAVEL